jgi:hypothetical protein
MRTRIVIALSLCATLAALAPTLSATASSLPALPAPIGNPCLSVTVTPHVVNAGGVVTARTGPGTGGCTQSRLEWNWFVNGEKSSTCGTSSASCEIKATREGIFDGVAEFDFEPAEVLHSPLATHIRHRRAR